MKTVIIHGQSHKGSTWHIATELAEKIGGETEEFFLPKDFGEFCLGCTTCFTTDEKKCPHYEKLSPITKAMDSADVLILDSPVYVYHATGSMKAWLDHYGYRWMVHSPEKSMFRKQAVCISTAAGAGMKSTNKDMADSLFFWGVPKIYKIGIAVAAISWDMITEKKRRAIDAAITKTAAKIRQRYGHVRPGFKTKFIFGIMRSLHKKGVFPKDAAHWKEMGWLEDKRPWK